MNKFRKKPVVIEATQWRMNGDHPEDSVIDGLGEGAVVRYYRVPGAKGGKCAKCSAPLPRHGWIDTLEGGHIVCPNDWIITGVQGEHYPCKPDIFEATYENAEAPMRQSEQVRLRTEIAQLNATLHQLRFALPLKKAAEELIEQWHDSDDSCITSRQLVAKVANLKEALDNKKRYEAVSDDPT